MLSTRNRKRDHDLPYKSNNNYCPGGVNGGDLSAARSRLHSHCNRLTEGKDGKDWSLFELCGAMSRLCLARLN